MALQKIKSQETGQKMRKRYYFRIARKEFYLQAQHGFLSVHVQTW